MKQLPVAAVDVREVPVREVMEGDVLTFSPNDPLRNALEVLEEYGLEAAPVVEAWSGRLVGVLSIRDVLRTQGEYGDGETGLTVAHGMTEDILCIEPEASMRQVCDLMNEAEAQRLLVTDAEQLVGIVTSMDIVRLLAR